MRIFAEDELSLFLGARLQALEQEVRQEDKNKLLNYDEPQYTDYLISRYTVNVLEIKWDEVRVSSREEMIMAERFPGDFNVYAGKSYPKQIVTYHLPISGDQDLLRFAPSSRILWTTEVGISSGSITFDIVNWRDDPQEIKREAERMISHIRSQAENVIREVSQWNATLPDKACQVVTSRKQQLLKQSNLLESLGVPIKKSETVSETFNVPIAKKRPIIHKPEASNKPFAPEPTLDPAAFQSILKICYEMGIEMERHPSVYFDKDEETLRDHFLMQLSPHFYSVTGETFNKQGKTDILIRHEGKNVFVAECKFWGGIKAFFETINQLLSYLTWRDSKAAIIVFIRNKEVGPVLKQIEEKTGEHSCFVKATAKRADGWFEFRFHLPDDQSRGVDIVVLCFHFPD